MKKKLSILALTLISATSLVIAVPVTDTPPDHAKPEPAVPTTPGDTSPEKPKDEFRDKEHRKNKERNFDGNTNRHPNYGSTNRYDGTNRHPDFKGKGTNRFHNPLTNDIPVPPNK